MRIYRKLVAWVVIVVVVFTGCQMDTLNEDINIFEEDSSTSTLVTEEKRNSRDDILEDEQTETTVNEENTSFSLSYKIVDTGLEEFFTDTAKVSLIEPGDAFYGQDAHYDGYQPNYKDNNDGTVTDLVTGLMWQQTMDEKMTSSEAIIYANSFNLGGYSDWRVPTIKELFSLILFTGRSSGEGAEELYIDTTYFDQPIGDTSIGEREIDAQTWSSTLYTVTSKAGTSKVFGVNFIDGRIKGYGSGRARTTDEFKGYFRLVRGNTTYGENYLIDNGNGTVSDLATGLMWQLADDSQTRNWEEALDYAEDLDLADYSDWRLPNIKELQSIVDYTKSVDSTNSPAIDDLFSLSEITDPNGKTNYGFYWSSTTHQDGKTGASSASYVAFGEAQGKMNDNIIDVHGAGAVRSDPKSGERSDYPVYFGPQGDIRYVYNHVIAVRTITDLIVDETTESSEERYNLFTPLSSTETYLMDMSDEVVHTWSSSYTPGNSVYLSDGGSILRTGSLTDKDYIMSSIGGAGGIVERIEWNGDVSWAFEYASEDGFLHHDIEELPNGNILMIAWEAMTSDEAIENGRNPDLIKDGEIWPDHIIEVNPSDKGGDIVWEWHLSDHLIQDYDSSKSNYGVIDEHPELVDINYIGTKSPEAGGADWTHMNSIDYNEALDQILLSVHGFNEIWIIDHSTSTEEAASHTGGNQTKGGDILFRWGNPEAYDNGDRTDKIFFGQHDARWIESKDGEMSILVFNNGVGRNGKNSNSSSVDQIAIPLDNNGAYLMSDGTYLPEELSWTYEADFYSQSISGAERLKNGNTLICNGSSGEFIEIDISGNIVWRYQNEFSQSNQGKSPVFRVSRYQLDINEY